MAQQVVLNASGLGPVITGIGSNVAVPVNGLITVNSDDVPALLRAGCSYVNSRFNFLNILAPRAASAARLVASTALSNGTLTIANQPDVARMGQLRVDPGAAPITAGNAAVRYIGNDGVDTTDNMSLIAPGTTQYSLNTSKGIMILTSVIVTNLAGGTSPVVQLNDTNALSVPVDPGFVNFAVFRETDNGTNIAIGTVASAAGSITPTSTPNSTINYGFGYTTSAADV